MHACLPRSQIALDAAIFVSNAAGGAGGALSVSAPALGAARVAISASGCTFHHNTAGSSVFELGSTKTSGFGGAVSVTSASKHRAAAVLAAQQANAASAAASNGGGNSSSSSSAGGGGALLAQQPKQRWGYLDNACSMYLERCAFEGNTALGNGAGAVHDPQTALQLRD
jgi:hypothetical protein